MAKPDENGHSLKRPPPVIRISSLPSSQSDFRASFVGESGGEIALARGAGDGDDELARVFRTFGDLDGGTDVRTSADADENALFFGDATRHGEGIIVADLDTFGDLEISG